VLSQGPVGTAVVRDAWTLSQKRRGPQVLHQTQPGTVAEGRRMTRLASSRTGENPPYGMIRGGGGNEVDGLMTFCHNARKGRYTGSHWSKPVAPPLYSTIYHSDRLSGISERFRDSWRGQVKAYPSTSEKNCCRHLAVLITVRVEFVICRVTNRAEFTRHSNYEMHHCFMRATCFLLGNDGLVCSGYFYLQ
jgi:hypothetical protein